MLSYIKKLYTSFLLELSSRRETSYTNFEIARKIVHFLNIFNWIKSKFSTLFCFYSEIYSYYNYLNVVRKIGNELLSFEDTE